MAEPNYVFKIKMPYGYEIVDANLLKDDDQFTDIVPNIQLIKPVFNLDKNVWEEYDVTSQIAQLAYQQMTTQQTITDLQTQNAQMAYQLMTQGGKKA